MRLFLSCMAVTALLGVAAAQTPDSLKNEIMKVDDAYRLAKLRNDTAALSDIFADEFNETNQNGNSRNKAESLDLWRSFKISSLTTDSAEVRVTGATAMVTGKQTEDGAVHMLFTRVYTMSRGRWQLLASMQFRDPKV